MDANARATLDKIIILAVAVLFITSFAIADLRSSTAHINNVSKSFDGWCGSTATVYARACMSCGTCMNGVTGNLNINGANFYLGDQGHNWDYLCWPTYSTSWTVGSTSGSTGTHSYPISVGFNSGCHCAGSSASTSISISCTDPNARPIVTLVEIENILPSRSGDDPQTFIDTVRNRTGATGDEFEQVKCYGEGYDTDGTVDDYSFYLKYKLPSGTRVSMTKGTDYMLLTQGVSGAGEYETFEIQKKIPVGSEIYCRLTLTDDDGATGSGESL